MDDKRAELELCIQQLRDDECKAQDRKSKIEDHLANAKLAESAPEYARPTASQISVWERELALANAELSRIQEKLREKKEELQTLDDPNFGLQFR